MAAALASSTFAVPVNVDPAHPAAAWCMRCVSNLAPSGTAAQRAHRKALCAAFKGARNRLSSAIRTGAAPPEPVRPLYVPPPPPPPPPPIPLYSRVFASVATLPAAGVRSGLGLVRAVDERGREVMLSTLGFLSARPALVFPFPPAYVVVAGSAALVHWDLIRDNRDLGFLEASRPLLVYLRLRSPTRSVLRGFFEDSTRAFLDSPRFLQAVARLPLRFARASALMRPLMAQLGVSLGLLPKPPAPVPSLL
ncbi:hypothetical protein N7520_005920 [Penicillium odoratum]|uniref:uncharacterized protein n=1 Tax=Penicillium odoratum TaxID=1167516 RepID=UPI0025487B8C|nr:uncharacterized protein N7520_005920 [Penicillium odoratum]KAJ5758764.1 hypothetical protein N7520_005920 [Penicillium odoratum]